MACIAAFNADLDSYTHVTNDVVSPVICAVCDMMPSEPHWAEWVAVQDVATACATVPNMAKLTWQGMYPEALLNSYTLGDARLDRYLLSPKTQIDSTTDQLLVCKQCWKHLQCGK